MWPRLLLTGWLLIVIAGCSRTPAPTVNAVQEKNLPPEVTGSPIDIPIKKK
jgi:hypothetical protein